MSRENTKGLLKKAGIVLAVLSLLVAASTPAVAISVYNTDASGYLTGSRTAASGGLKAVGGTLQPTAAVDWLINWTGTEWNYLYTFSGFKYDMSHVTFDVSDAFAYPGSGLISYNDQPNVVSVGLRGNQTTTSIAFGDPLANIVGAFKVEIPNNNEGQFTIEFQSTNAPMWGDIYLKNGVNYTGANWFYNAHSATDNIFGYIAVPDSQGAPVPEPATMLLMGVGLVGLVGAKRRFRKR